VAVGYTILFRPNVAQLPFKGLLDGVLYSNEKWKIAVLVGNNATYNAQTGKSDFSCSSVGWFSWHPIDLGITLLEPSKPGCWAVGTITLTAGVRAFQQGLYVTNGTVEAVELLEQGESQSEVKLSPDPWAEYALFMLNDLMFQLARIRRTSMVGGNLTTFTEEIIRQAYIAMRHALPRGDAHVQQQLQIYSPEPFLEAKVDRLRVWVWLGLSMLLPVMASDPRDGER